MQSNDQMPQNHPLQATRMVGQFFAGMAIRAGPVFLGNERFERFTLQYAAA